MVPEVAGGAGESEAGRMHTWTVLERGGRIGGPWWIHCCRNRDMSLGTVHLQETVRGRAVYNFKSKG